MNYHQNNYVKYAIFFLGLLIIAFAPLVLNLKFIEFWKVIFTDITAEERNKAVLEFQENARKKALEKGILKRADENAELVVKNFVMSTAGPEYHVTLERRP